MCRMLLRREGFRHRRFSISITSCFRFITAVVLLLVRREGSYVCYIGYHTIALSFSTSCVEVLYAIVVRMWQILLVGGAPSNFTAVILYLYFCIFCLGKQALADLASARYWAIIVTDFYIGRTERG